MQSNVINLTLAVLTIVSIGCKRSYDGHEEAFLFRGKVIVFSPDLPKSPLTISDTVFKPLPTFETRYEILLSLARIPTRDIPISEITVPWNNDPKLCRVLITQGDHKSIALYLKRDDKGIWRLQEAEGRTG
jgi:hypothetical protein